MLSLRRQSSKLMQFILSSWSLKLMRTHPHLYLCLSYSQIIDPINQWWSCAAKASHFMHSPNELSLKKQHLLLMPKSPIWKCPKLLPSLIAVWVITMTASLGVSKPPDALWYVLTLFCLHYISSDMWMLHVLIFYSWCQCIVDSNVFTSNYPTNCSSYIDHGSSSDHDFSLWLINKVRTDYAHLKQRFRRLYDSNPPFCNSSHMVV